MSATSLRKLIWAFDAMESLDLQKNALLTLEALSRKVDARIEPVYILGGPYAQAIEGPPGELEKAFLALAEKNMSALVHDTVVENMSQGKVLANRGGTTSSNVTRLLDYAKEVGADAILVATHARRGLSRLFMGSFAETLALRSPIPILTVNPQAKVRETISKVMLPTTFKSRYRETFERIVAFCREFEAELILYYKEPPMTGYDQSIEVYRFLKSESAGRAKVAEGWRSWAHDQGVRASVILDHEPGSVSSCIEEFAAGHDVDLIAMATQADNISAALMGSLSRQVVRLAPCPVWVMKIHEPEANASTFT